MRTVEIYKVSKVMEAVPNEVSYLSVNIFDKESYECFTPIDMEEHIEVKHLPITKLTQWENGAESNRYVAYDPSLESELGYPVTVMTDLLRTQEELDSTLRKLELEKIKNEQAYQWYEDNIKNASLTTRLKWVLTGVQ